MHIFEGGRICVTPGLPGAGVRHAGVHHAVPNATPARESPRHVIPPLSAPAAKIRGQGDHCRRGRIFLRVIVVWGKFCGAEALEFVLWRYFT